MASMVFLQPNSVHRGNFFVRKTKFRYLFFLQLAAKGTYSTVEGKLILKLVDHLYEYSVEFAVVISV